MIANPGAPLDHPASHLSRPDGDPLCDLGVVVVAYASEADLGPCLAALPLDRLARVVVVDNASPVDPELSMRGEVGRHSRVRLLRLARNVGFAAAATQGAEALGDVRWVAFVNPDVRVDGAALTRLVARLVDDPTCAVVGPRLIDAEGRPITGSGELARLATELRYALPRHLAWTMPERRHAGEHRGGRVGYVEGACFVVRRSVWCEVGGFGDTGFLFFEEMRLAQRVRAAGYSVQLAADAVALHRGGGSLSGLALGGRDHYVHETVRYLRDFRGPWSARTFRVLAGAWWWLAARTGRLSPAAARRLRAALYLSPPPPSRPGHQALLLVGTELPWPPATGAARRIAALHAELASVSDVRTLLALRDPAAASLPPDAVVWLTRRSGSRVRSALVAARLLVSDRPLWGAFYRRRGPRRAIRRALDLCSPSLVLTHELGGAELCHRVIPARRTVLDMHNAEDLLTRELVGLSSSITRLRLRIDSRRLPRWTSRNLASYALTTAVSEADRAHLNRLLPTPGRLVLAPNGADVTEAPRPDPGGQTLLFLGDLRYAPNQDAVRYCVDLLLPRLPPGARLRVVGRGEPPKHPQLERVGYAADLRPEWNRATVLVAPLRVSGGSPLKILEAFAAGVPVVCTSTAVQGLDGARHGEHLLVADCPDAFAEAVSRLLADSALRLRLADAARCLAERRFSWHRCLAPLVIGTLRLAPLEPQGEP